MLILGYTSFSATLANKIIEMNLGMARMGEHNEVGGIPGTPMV